MWETLQGGPQAKGKWFQMQTPGHRQERRGKKVGHARSSHEQAGLDDTTLVVTPVDPTEGQGTRENERLSLRHGEWS